MFAKSVDRAAGTPSESEVHQRCKGRLFNFLTKGLPRGLSCGGSLEEVVRSSIDGAILNFCDFYEEKGSVQPTKPSIGFYDADSSTWAGMQSGCSTTTKAEMRLPTPRYMPSYGYSIEKHVPI